MHSSIDELLYTITSAEQLVNAYLLISVKELGNTTSFNASHSPNALSIVVTPSGILIDTSPVAPNAS